MLLVIDNIITLIIKFDSYNFSENFQLILRYLKFKKYMVLLINEKIEFELLLFEKLLSESKICDDYFSYDDFICSIEKTDENYKKNTRFK